MGKPEWQAQNFVLLTASYVLNLSCAFPPIQETGSEASMP